MDWVTIMQRYGFLIHLSNNYMKKLSIIYALAILISACNLFENREKNAIEICQKAKVQIETDNPFANLFQNSVLGENVTWLDYANRYATDSPDKKYNWKAKATGEKNIYLVSFVDEDGWGLTWEVDMEQQIVKFVNPNEYLSRKYDLSRFDPDENFQITNIIMDTLKLENKYDEYSENKSKKVVYVLKASVLNKSGKTLTNAKISGKLQLIFKDRTINGEGNRDDFDAGEGRFKTIISKSKPWNPNTERDFFIKTKGIEDIYLDYEPEYVVFDVELEAEDPIGYSFDKCIEEYDIKDRWKALK
jgi:hypothetical protein